MKPSLRIQKDAPTKLGRYGRMAQAHWKKHLPVYYRYLRSSQRLEEELIRAERKAIEAIEAELRLMETDPSALKPTASDSASLPGAAHNSALWCVEERILPLYILLPPET